VVAGGDDAGADALGAPGGDDEVADAGGDAHEAVLLDAELLGVLGVDPQRVAVADLVEPLRVAERVWMRVGMRNVGSRMRSLPARSRSSQWTWDGIHFGVAYSGQPQSLSVVENSSSFFDGVGNPP
jgi:hypothetical protein